MNLQEVRDHFAMVFEGTAEWRMQKAVEYPDDGRNQVAVEELQELSGQASDIEPGAAEAYWRLSEDIDMTYRLTEIEQEALRSIGFSNSYSTATKFVDTIVSEVSRSESFA